jgi:hypothetical protein
LAILTEVQFSADIFIILYLTVNLITSYEQNEAFRASIADDTGGLGCCTVSFGEKDNS